MAKEMKRYVFVFFFVCIILSSFFVLGDHTLGHQDGGNAAGRAAAGGGSVQEAAEGAGATGNIIANSVLVFMLGLFGLTGEVGLLEGITYLFMGLILFLFSYSIIRSMGFFGQPGDFHGAASAQIISGLISFAVTALVLVALPQGFFSVILPSYGAMGAAILTMIPFFMVMWFSLKAPNVLLARFSWGVFSFYYIMYYLALAASSTTATTPVVGKWIADNDLGLISGIPASQGYAWIYLMMAVVGVIMLFSTVWLRKWAYKGMTEDEKNKLAQNMDLITTDDVTRLKHARTVSSAGGS